VSRARKPDPVPAWHENAEVPAWHENAEVPAWHENAEAPAWHENAEAPAWHENAEAPAWHENAEVPAWHENAEAPAWHENAADPYDGDAPQNGHPQTEASKAASELLARLNDLSLIDIFRIPEPLVDALQRDLQDALDSADQLTEWLGRGKTDRLKSRQEYADRLALAADLQRRAALVQKRLMELAARPEANDK
jgi:hypothetical protein